MPGHRIIKIALWNTLIFHAFFPCGISLFLSPVAILGLIFNLLLAMTG